MNRRQLISWSFLVIYTLNLLVSSMLHPEQLPSFLLMMDDKLLHAFEHFLLFFFALAAFRYSGINWLERRFVLASFLYCLLIGALIEVEQLWVSYRHSEMTDWLADLLGVVVAWLAFRFLPFIRNLYQGRDEV